MTYYPLAALAGGTKGDTGAPSAQVAIPVASGGYYSQSVNAAALVTVAGAANRLDFIPFIPARNFTCNELALEVTTLLAASTAHVGIYADASGVPGAKLVASASALDCSTTGVKVASVSQTLTAGAVYWLAVLTSSTQTLRAVPVAGMIPLAAPASGTAIPTVRRATFTFAALPSTAPATTATSAIAPWVRLRAA